MTNNDIGRTHPLVTVITVVYNGEKTIQRAIESVISQSYTHIEYIVVDGGSDDSTVELVRRFGGRIAHLVSEPDDGIYHAMNKGIAIASGEIVAFLNSDDWYESDAVEQMVASIGPDYDFGFADCFLVDSLGRRYAEKRAHVPINQVLPYRMPFPHQTHFTRRDLLLKMGGFDVRYRLAADLDLICRLSEMGARGVYVQRPLANFTDGGASKQYWEMFAETRRVAIAHGMTPIVASGLFLWSIVKSVLNELLPLRVVDLIRKATRSNTVGVRVR